MFDMLYTIEFKLASGRSEKQSHSIRKCCFTIGGLCINKHFTDVGRKVFIITLYSKQVLSDLFVGKNTLVYIILQGLLYTLSQVTYYTINK